MFSQKFDLVAPCVCHLQAIDALAEVFVVALLPDRRLTAFADQPLHSVQHAAASDKAAQKQLLYYHLENCIKTR